MSNEEKIQKQIRKDAASVGESFRFSEDGKGNMVVAKSKQPEEKPKQEKSPYTSQTGAAKGALKAVTDYISFENDKAKENDDTIVDVKVRNPFHRILKLLQDIKSKQSTTVSMRFTIPLIALPIVILAAFQLGKAQTACSSRFTSQIGVIRTLEVMKPVESTDIYSYLISFFPDIPKLQKEEALQTMKSTILVDIQGKVLNVLHSDKINLKEFNNQGVILSGTLSPCTSIITLDSEKNITSTN